MAEVRRMGAMEGVRTGTIRPHLLLEVAVAVVLHLPGQADLEATQRQVHLRPRPLMAGKEAAVTTAGAPWHNGEALHHPLQVVQEVLEVQAPCLRHQWDTRAGAGLHRVKALVSQVSCQTSWELHPHLLLRVN